MAKLCDTCIVYCNSFLLDSLNPVHRSRRCTGRNLIVFHALLLNESDQYTAPAVDCSVPYAGQVQSSCKEDRNGDGQSTGSRGT
jgi:hypothetical protein